MNSPRILFVGPMLGTNPGWVPNPMEILAPYLEARGYTCLFSSRIVNRYARFADILQTLYTQRHQYDVVCLQVYSGPSFVVEDGTSVLAKALCKPVVMVLHGGAMPGYMKKYPRWSRAIFRRADAIVTPSMYLAEAISDLGFQAIVIPNIISIEEYPFTQRNSVRPKLLWMRTFYEYYNPQMAVRVLEDLLHDFPEAELTLAGQEKGTEGEVRRLVAELGLGERVHFPGFLDAEKKRGVFSQHDIFLNTTFIDNMPVCLLEAGAFGLPIVSTNVGGVPYMVKHEQSALLVEPGDVKAMAHAVRRLIRDPQLASTLSSNGRIMAEQSSPERVVPLWEELMRKFASSSVDRSGRKPSTEKNPCAASAA